MSEDFQLAPRLDPRGTSREHPLRPALLYRLAMTTVWGYFVYDTVHDTADGARDDNPVGYAVTIAITLGLTYVVTRLWSTHAWVSMSYEPGSTIYYQHTIEKTQFGRHSVGYLRSPHTLHVKGHPYGQRPSWRICVHNPDGDRQFTLSAPWINDFARLAQLLVPVVTADPRLVTDDRTRELLGLGTRGHRPQNPRANDPATGPRHGEFSHTETSLIESPYGYIKILGRTGLEVKYVDNVFRVSSELLATPMTIALYPDDTNTHGMSHPEALFAFTTAGLESAGFTVEQHPSQRTR